MDLDFGHTTGILSDNKNEVAFAKIPIPEENLIEQPTQFGMKL